MTGRLENVFGHGQEMLRGGYSALTTACAYGLLVLLLWPQSPRTYRAEATAVASSETQISLAANDAIDWLQSDEVLRAALANLRTNHPQTFSIALDGTSGDPVQTLRQRIEVVPLASPDEMPRLSIGCRAARPHEALAAADELARQLAAHYGIQRRHDVKSRYEEQQLQVKQELDEARSAQERLEVELQGLRHAQLTSALAASVPAPADAAPSAAAAPEPRSTELKRTLDSLKVERDRLLEVYLPAHPQVQALVAQISHLEESLKHPSPEAEDDGAPATNSPAPGAGSQRPILEWKRDPASPETSAPADHESSDTGLLAGELTAAIQNAQLDLLAATHRRQQAEQKLQSLSAERADDESVGNITWSIQPAQIIGAESSSQGQPQLAAALLASVGGGLAAVWLTRLAAHDRPLASAAELGRRLSLPVLGTLESSHDETNQLPPQTRAQRGANLLARCAEVVVVTFAVTLVAAVALDRGLFSDLMVDPLGALSELVRRLV